MEVQLQDVTMKFDNVLAVNRLNATIPDGALVSLLGPSGCGKSTILFLLAGLYEPSAGNIVFDGEIVNRIPPEKREIGMVFQNYALYPHMTVLKNIMFPLRMQKRPKAEALERARNMAELVRIEHLLDRKPGQLSGGQQQRVAIARALVKEPKMLLLDEPLSNLDARLRLEMREEIRRIQQEIGITAVFVTHDQEEAMSISDEILLLNEGKAQQKGKPQELYRHPANEFVARFIGNPQINMLPAEWKRDTGLLLLWGTDRTIPFFRMTEPGEVPEQVLLGVRPEDFRLVSPDRGLITGRVGHVETIGRDTLLRVECGPHSIRMMASSDADCQVGDEAGIDIRMEKVHLFDPESGMNLNVRNLNISRELIG